MATSDTNYIHSYPVYDPKIFNRTSLIRLSRIQYSRNRHLLGLFFYGFILTPGLYISSPAHPAPCYLLRPSVLLRVMKIHRVLNRQGLEFFASTIKFVEGCIFNMEKVDEDASLEFKWLKRRGFGGKKKEIQFYESFIYDGVKYMLYDCVYMYKEGLREPYIGKLIKIWELRDSKTKKVKVQWFFRPEEISKWLGDTTTLENEIFFASGEGVGLANINPLEAIAGQCNVVCVSKDRRNPQPSDEELKVADFIFYRTFDVQSCSILDKMEEKVGGLGIEYIFNRKEGENTSTLPQSISDRKEENQNTTTCGEVHQLLTKSLTNKLKDDKEDIKLSAEVEVKVDAKGESQGKDIPNLLAENDSCILKADKDNSRLKDMPFSKDKAGKDEMKTSMVPIHKVEAKERNKPPTGSDKLHDRPLKKIMPDDKNPSKEKQVELEVAGDSDRLKDMPSKKSEVEKSIKLPDRSGWFRRLVQKLDKKSIKLYKPWEERLKNAYDQGTAVLLYNVDPNYTSGEVEDIIWHALTENCEAKILQRTAVSSPHYGQALILLKTKEAAQRVLAKLDEECLMLSNGRPLVAITCPPILDEAVSTSHFSQPNTIEYDMAMEWSLLQSRSKKWWEMIHKKSGTLYNATLTEPQIGFPSFRAGSSILVPFEVEVLQFYNVSSSLSFQLVSSNSKNYGGTLIAFLKNHGLMKMNS
ncbi:Bromo adjacent homology (BAH) domain-containing protein, partial [Cynara cardunculus var. scolymus]